MVRLPGSAPPVGDWLSAFLLTNILELPVYGLVLRKHLAPPWRAWALTLFVNVCTHPAFWYLFPYFDAGEPFVTPYVGWVLIAEACVIAVEGGLVFGALCLAPGASPLPLARRIGLALWASGMANVASAVLGLALQRWTRWGS
jgi:hypothetical protein